MLFVEMALSELDELIAEPRQSPNEGTARMKQVRSGARQAAPHIRRQSRCADGAGINKTEPLATANSSVRSDGSASSRGLQMDSLYSSRLDWIVISRRDFTFPGFSCSGPNGCQLPGTST